MVITYFIYNIFQAGFIGMTSGEALRFVVRLKKDLKLRVAPII